MDALVEKYNVSGPRYTSYPSVPFWKHNPLTPDLWLETLAKNYAHFESEDISVYVHLPYCESLCTFCGCHKRITKNKGVQKPYIEALLKEWALYRSHLGFTPYIRELHFGGGTPTFFTADHLLELLTGVFGTTQVDPEEIELSFEAHPNNTEESHLAQLYDFGFRRLSMGVQDYSPVVQNAINRIQTFERVRSVHRRARELGYTSIGHDLVFGLPKQTLADIQNSISKTVQLQPDRISLYSYAHVPWVKGTGQRGFDESDLPQDSKKRQLYLKAKHMLEDAGYIEIGMDHFALPTDKLAIAFQSKTLHRNFMGYTTQSTKTLLGLGMSAISDSWFGFAQNDKSAESYLEKIDQGVFPIFRGHISSPQDLEIRSHILDLMCHFETTLDPDSPFKEVHESTRQKLQEMVHDGLVELQGNRVRVTPEGIPFVRNCCMAFDQDISSIEGRDSMFSKTV